MSDGADVEDAGVDVGHEALLEGQVCQAGESRECIWHESKWFAESRNVTCLNKISPWKRDIILPLKSLGMHLD